MMKTDCTKLDCFFRVGDMCCNLCAIPDDSCNLYFRAEQDTADRPPGLEDRHVGENT